MIDQPGVYYELADALYHADLVPDGSLSVSGAKRLLPPSCPAKFRYWLGKEEHKPIYDFGHAVHTRILGIGEQIDVIDAIDWKTKAARTARDKAYAAHRVPLLACDVPVIDAMAEELDRHSYASQLLGAPGRAEVSLFWRDDTTDIMRRARLDYLHDNGEIAVDYKSSVSVEPTAISKAMYSNGYYMQAPWYQDAVVGCGLLEYLPEFIFMFQEKTPPYLVTVIQPDEEMLAYGRLRNREAIELYYQCKTFDHWPGYAEQPVTVSLPRWAIRELESA